MALTKAKVREILSEAGVESEKISDAVDKIIDGHVTSINALREERDNLKKDADKLADTEKELNELKKTIESNEKDPYKVKYEAKKEEFENFKKQIAEKESKKQKEDAYIQLLKESNVSEKRIKAIIKASEDSINSVKFDKDGKIENAEDLKKAIAEEWDDFIEKTVVKGAKTEKPPANDGKQTMTKEQIMAIKNGVERRKAIAENKDLFGIGDE